MTSSNSYRPRSEADERLKSVLFYLIDSGEVHCLPALPFATPAQEAEECTLDYKQSCTCISVGPLGESLHFALSSPLCGLAAVGVAAQDSTQRCILS